MPGFYEASDYSKISLGTLCITGLLHIIAYGSPYWTTRFNGNAGLWTGCADGMCYERWNQWVPQWIKASQAFMTMTVILLFTAILCHFLYIFHKHFENDKRMVLVSCVFTFFSSAFIFLAVVTWAANEYYGNTEVLNWPFAFACLSSLTALTSAIFLLYELRSPYSSLSTVKQ